MSDGEKRGFENEYSDEGFWAKLRQFALVAGKEVIEKALWLYYAAQDPATPVWAKSISFGALGYFIFPIDAIPDVIVPVGYADDLGVLAAAVATVALHITPEAKGRAAQKLKDWFGVAEDTKGSAMGVVEIVMSIQKGSLQSYTWVADRLGYSGGQAARAAGQAIAKETLRRFPDPRSDECNSGDDFPWWRVVGLHGDVRTALENQEWFMRQVRRLESEGHTLHPSPEVDGGLRVSPLPRGFE